MGQARQGDGGTDAGTAHEGDGGRRPAGPATVTVREHAPRPSRTRRWVLPALAAGTALTVGGFLAVPQAEALQPSAAARDARPVAAQATAQAAGPDVRQDAGQPTPTPTTPSTTGPTIPAPTDPGPPPSPMVGGYDVSWTQCPVSQGGYGNPLPAGRTTFALIGLSKGSAFTTNPCLADQVAWARAAHLYVAAYVFPTYPTNAEFATYGSKGPYPTKTFQGRLMNVGWWQAVYWTRVAKAAGVTTPMVWVDVEQKKKAFRWTSRPDLNLAVVRGVLAGLAHAKLRTGIYTTPAHWLEITGGVRLGLPEWRTVGPLTATDAFAACTKPGVQGNPVLVAQYYTQLAANNYDYDVMCPVTRTGGRLTRYFAKW